MAISDNDATTTWRLPRVDEPAEGGSSLLAMTKIGGFSTGPRARVTSIKSDDVMSLVKFDVIGPAEMASVLTYESDAERELRVGDEVGLLVKAIRVLPVKD